MALEHGANDPIRVMETPGRREKARRLCELISLDHSRPEFRNSDEKSLVGFGKTMLVENQQFDILWNLKPPVN